jgi:hypothetical protein
LSIPFLVLSLLAAICVFVLLWIRFRVQLGKDPYDFDASGEKGAFEPHLQRYQSIAKLLLSLATAAAAFLFKFLADLPLDTYTFASGLGLYGRALMQGAPGAIVFLTVSAFCSLAFMISQTYLYEAYCHSKDRTSFTGTQYSAVLAFAYSAVLWFIVAFGFLAYKIVDLGI